LPKGSSFLEFIAKKDLPYGSWSEHVKSWLIKLRGQESFLMIKYEDLQADPFETLTRVLRFIKVESTPSRIHEAISKSSFNKMKRIENLSGLPEDIKFAGSFIREGKVSGWRKYFGGSEITQFKKYHTDALIALGYETSEEWE
jgi:hypothetical protein